jgi:hypothetical protein
MGKNVAVILNEKAYNRAKALVVEGRVVLDQRDDWSEHQPSAQQENEFIDDHGFAEYGRWYLGSTTNTTRTRRADQVSLRGFQKRAPLRCARGREPSRAEQVFRHRERRCPPARDDRGKTGCGELTGGRVRVMSSSPSAGSMSGPRCRSPARRDSCRSSTSRSRQLPVSTASRCACTSTSTIGGCAPRNADRQMASAMSVTSTPRGSCLRAVSTAAAAAMTSRRSSPSS